MADSPTTRTQVFISYSHADTEYLKRLKKHLKPHIRDGTIREWDDTQIQPGSDWLDEIEQALQSARVAVLLVSVDFLASDFVAEKELPTFLKAAKDEGALILPVIVGTCEYSETKLGRFQALNDPSRPLKRLSVDEQDEVWVKLVKRVREALAAPPPYANQPAPLLKSDPAPAAPTPLKLPPIGTTLLTYTGHAEPLYAVT